MTSEPNPPLDVDGAGTDGPSPDSGDEQTITNPPMDDDTDGGPEGEPSVENPPA